MFCLIRPLFKLKVGESMGKVRLHCTNKDDKSNKANMESEGEVSLYKPTQS